MEQEEENKWNHHIPFFIHQFTMDIYIRYTLTHTHPLYRVLHVIHINERVCMRIHALSSKHSIHNAQFFLSPRLFSKKGEFYYFLNLYGALWEFFCKDLNWIERKCHENIFKFPIKWIQKVVR